MSLLLPIGLLCLCPVLVYDFLLMDKLIAFERANYPVDWERDGCPDGFFHHPEGIWDANDRHRSLAFGWFLEAPEWAKKHEQTRAWLRCYRFCILIWLVGLPAVVFSSVPHQSAHSVKTTPVPMQEDR